jgi:lipopolysaccharide/colanic/teichoic acid biosynthesis glycosyltransferase
VPNSLEAIIGKPSIDELETFPLVEIDYNIHKFGHRIAKRAFDLIVAALLLPVYPLVRLMRKPAEASGVARFILLLPRVFLGRISLVGRPLDDPDDDHLPAQPTQRSYLGPRGITGLVQINQRDDLTGEDIERYKLYYAKNQSLMLDVEILLKALLRSVRR